MNIRETKLFKDWEGFCKLNDIQETDFILGGSTILFIKGIRKRIRDMDIIITNPKIWNKLLEKYKKEKSKSTREKIITILGERIELGNDFLSTYKEFEFKSENPKHVEIIDGLRVMTLRVVEKYKRILKRQKDKRDLRLIDKYKTKQGKERRKIY